jgi:hypothetical protein
MKTVVEIIRMAREADDYADEVIQMPGEYHPDWHTVRDEHFAALVAEATRNDIADFIEHGHSDDEKHNIQYAQSIRSMK